MKYTLGIDLGTSYFKLGLYDEALNLKGLGRVAVEKNTGHGNLCELPTEKFVQLIQDGIAEACRQAHVSAAQIGAIGYSSQASSFALMDKRGNALTPLVLWTDQRADVINPKITQLWNESDFVSTTGLGLEPSSTLFVNKLLWFKAHETKIWSRAAKVFTISDYLTTLFTGELFGDVGTASLLGILNNHTGAWWDKALNILDLDPSMLIPRLSVGTVAGGVSKEAERLFGLQAGTQFYIGSLDHHIAALGAGVRDSEDMSESTGTVLACVNFTDEYAPRTGICIAPWKKGWYAQLAYSGNGAVALEWYQQNFAPEHSIAELVAMAEDTGGSSGLQAKPMAYNCKTLEQAFVGIKKTHNHGHFMYALMESTAHTLDDLIQTLAPKQKPRKIVATGGGARSKLWLDIKQSITGAKIVQTDIADLATRGAALLASEQ